MSLSHISRPKAEDICLWLPFFTLKITVAV